MIRTLVLVGLALALVSGASATTATATSRIDHVTDGDTVVLRNGQKVRLVQIDTPEVYFGTECYGPQASATTKRLLPVGTKVRLLPEPGAGYWGEWEVQSGSAAQHASRRESSLTRRFRGTRRNPATPGEGC